MDSAASGSALVDLPQQAHDLVRLVLLSLSHKLLLVQSLSLTGTNLSRALDALFAVFPKGTVFTTQCAQGWGGGAPLKCSP